MPQFFFKQIRKYKIRNYKKEKMTKPNRTPNTSLFDLRRSYACIQVRIESYAEKEHENATEFIGNYLNYPVEFITGLDFCDVSISIFRKQYFFLDSKTNLYLRCMLILRCV